MRFRLRTMMGPSRGAGMVMAIAIAMAVAMPVACRVDRAPHAGTDPDPAASSSSTRMRPRGLPQRVRYAAGARLADRSLALAMPRGDGALEKQISPAGGVAPGTTAVGRRGRCSVAREFARHAESSDPGFYLNADACATTALGLAPNERRMDLADARAAQAITQSSSEARALAQRVIDGHSEDPMPATGA